MILLLPSNVKGVLCFTPMHIFSYLLSILSRVFYLIDLTCPTKKEIILHPEDKGGPDEYDPAVLHHDLIIFINSF